jgi:hypothetical protein
MGSIPVHSQLLGDIVVRQNGLNAALPSHPGVAILHVNLPDQNEFKAEAGQELLIGIGAQDRRDKRRPVCGKALEYRFNPFKTGLRQNGFEPLVEEPRAG